MEIERKFLLNAIPKLPFYETSIVEQGYLSFDPEVRVRRKTILPNGLTDYVLTVKGNGDLSRFESEVLITQKFFNEMKYFINKPFIKKIYSKYLGQDNYTYEFFEVDNGQFLYAEVEFRTEEEANEFKWSWPEVLEKEITYDKKYKMKNYWKDKNFS